jgi:hypothetical protein
MNGRNTLWGGYWAARRRSCSRPSRSAARSCIPSVPTFGSAVRAPRSGERSRGGWTGAGRAPASWRNARQTADWPSTAARAPALADPLPGVAGFPDQSELLRELGRNGGFTPAAPLPNVVSTPDQSGDLRDLTRPGGFTSAAPLPNVLSTPMPSHTLPNIVTMADPNDTRAIAAQDRAHEHLSQAFPEAVIVTNREYCNANGQVIGEIDLTLDGIPIEVTVGRGKGNLEQVSRIEALTGTAPVVYGERLSPTVERNLRDNGVSVATSLEELEAILRDLRGAE